MVWEVATYASSAGYCFFRHKRCKIREVMDFCTVAPKSCRCWAMCSRRHGKPLHEAMKMRSKLQCRLQVVGDAATMRCLPRKATGLNRSWVKKETVCAMGGRARRMGLTQALQSQDNTVTGLLCQTWNHGIWFLVVQALITKWLP